MSTSAVVVTHDALLDAWEIPRPRVLTPASWGWNNDTFFVSSAGGEHVLRISSAAERAEIELEHDILSRLAGASLPFATPTPVVSRDGATVLTFRSERGQRPASLFTRINGTHPEDEDVDLIAASSAAFGALDLALAKITVKSASRPMSTDLASVSRDVPTLADIERDVGAEATSLVRAAEADAAILQRTLPRQLIHGDFALGNVLIESDRVAGIIDFEFSGVDLRAMELATGLGLVLTKSSHDRLWRPFVESYLGTMPLTEAERRALPILTRLGRAIGLIWWVGKERDRRSTKSDTAERVDRLRQVDGWMSRNGNALVDVAMQVEPLRREH